jgi:VanZ family protein
VLPLRHRQLWIATSAGLVAAVVYASLKPDFGPAVPAGFDKLEHMSAYLLLTVWFAGLYPPAAFRRIGAALLALGVCLEVMQGLMHMGRSAEVLDAAANAAGIGLGLLFALKGLGGWARRVEAWLSST